MSRRGASLVEVVVAAVVFQIGVLGALGLGSLAARLLGQAASIQRAAWWAEEVADSLGRFGFLGPGERREGDARVTWEADGDRVLVRVWLAGDADPPLLEMVTLRAAVEPPLPGAGEP